MSRAARSMLVWGIYLVVNGITLIAAPNFLLGLLRLPPTTEVWVRLLGLIVLILGLYYSAAGRGEDMLFARSTVWGRTLFLGGVVLLVVLGVAPAALLVFGVLDVLGAAWTWRALKSALAAPMA